MTFVKRGYKKLIERELGLAKGLLGRALRLAEVSASEDIVEGLRESLKNLDRVISLLSEAEVVRG